jgi:hypothetical protein
MSLTQALEHLPISSSVYVVYATRQQRIHIVSRSVNSLYCVVKSQLEIESELMADDSAHLNQLFNSWTWQQGDDQSGYLMEFLLVHSSIKLGLEIPHPLFLISHSPLQEGLIH